MASAPRWRRRASTGGRARAEMSEGQPLRGLHLHFDGASGAAGDMMLGALLDLGVPRVVIEEVFDRVGLGKDRLEVARVVKHGLAAVNVTIRIDDRDRQAPHAGGQDHTHDHAHSHDHAHTHDHARTHDHDHEYEYKHEHHPYRDIVARI